MTFTSKVYAKHFNQRTNNAEVATISDEVKFDIQEEIEVHYDTFVIGLEHQMRLLKESLAETSLMLKAANKTHDKMVDLYVDEKIKLFTERAKSKFSSMLKKARVMTGR